MSEFIQALSIISIVAIVAMGKNFKGKINNESEIDISIDENNDKKNK